MKRVVEAMTRVTAKCACMVVGLAMIPILCVWEVIDEIHERLR